MVLNPDGAVAGNYRDNIRGVNLNRVWDGSANAEDSPEVLAVERAIDAWVAAGNDYRMFLDFHSMAGPRRHFAFHGGPAVTKPEYYAETKRYLALVEGFAPVFGARYGASDSRNRALAYHSQREKYGVQALTPEGSYSKHNHGPTPDAFMTPATHREVGVAFGRALVAFHGLMPPPTE